MGASTGLPNLTVVLVHYRAPEWCNAAVESVLASSAVSLEVVVVDNSGELTGLPDSVRMIRPSTNTGYAGGANLAVRAWLDRGGRYCFVAAHDLTVEPDALSRLVSAAEAHPDFGVLAPWFTPRVARVGELGEHDGIVEFEWVSGSGYLLRRECLTDVGLFDEDFGSYCEDRELCMRARLHGWRVGAVRAAGASSRGSAHRERALVMMHGNQVLLWAKYGRWRHAAQLLARELWSIPRELAVALRPGRSTRGALRRARVHARTVLFALGRLGRWLLRGGRRADPLADARVATAAREAASR